MAEYVIIPAWTSGDSFDPFTFSGTDRLETVTTADLKAAYEDSKQLQESFGSFDNYESYIADSQDIIAGADWWDAEPTYQQGTPEYAYLNNEDFGWAPGQKEEIAQKVIQDQKNARYSAYMNWMNGPEFSALRDQYGLQDVVYNQDGDQYKWTGTGYQKTMKVDDHASFGDYAKVILQTAVTSALTYGATSAAGIGSANDAAAWLSKTTGLSPAASTAAINSVVSNGVQQIAQGTFDPEKLLVSAVGASIGMSVAQELDFITSAVGNSAVAGAVASTVEQAILNGEVDINTVIQSGLLSGGTTLVSDVVSDILKGGEVDLGGLIDPKSDLGVALTEIGQQAKAEFDSWFTTQTTEGFVDADGNFITEQEAVDRYGEDFVANAINSSAAGTDYQGWTTAQMVSEGALESLLDAPEAVLESVFQPIFGDDWLVKSSEFLNEVLNSDTSEGGGAVIATSEPTGGTGAPVEPCTDPNRVQLASGGCGGCKDGYQVNDFGDCVEVTTEEVCGDGQVYNELAGACVDEEFFEEGMPCNVNGTSGTYDANGNCVEDVVDAGDGEGEGDGEGDGTNGEVVTEGTPSEGKTPQEICAAKGKVLSQFDPDPRADDDGCIDVTPVTPEPEPEPEEEEEPTPTGPTLEEVKAKQKECTDQGLEYDAENNECLPRPTPVEETPNPAVVCDQKGGVYAPDDPNRDEDGCVFSTATPPTGETEGPQTEEQCTQAGGQWVEETKECNVVTTETSGATSAEECAASGGQWVEATQECLVNTVTPTTGGGGGGGGGFGGLGSNITEPTGLLSPMGVDPQLLQRKQFPITDYLTGLFTGLGK